MYCPSCSYALVDRGRSSHVLTNLAAGSELRRSRICADLGNGMFGHLRRRASEDTYLSGTLYLTSTSIPHARSNDSGI